MGSIVKKCSAMVLAILFIFCCCPLPSAFAADTDTYEETFVKDLGNGIIMTSTLTVSPSYARYSNKSGVLKSDFTANGTWIATVTLTGNFKYNGMVAGVVSSSYTKSLASGWTYSNHNISETDVSSSSGGTIHLTANLRKFPLVVPVDMTMHCSPSGVITTS